MWGCHGDPISSYPQPPLTHPHLPPPPPPPLPPPPPPPPPAAAAAWLQTGRRKIKRGKKHFGGSDNDSGGEEGGGGGGGGGGEEEKERRCWWLGEQLVSRLANTDMAVFRSFGGIVVGTFYRVCVSVVYAVESLVFLLWVCHLRAANRSLQSSVKKATRKGEQHRDKILPWMFESVHMIPHSNIWLQQSSNINTS